MEIHYQMIPLSDV